MVSLEVGVLARFLGRQSAHGCTNSDCRVGIVRRSRRPSTTEYSVVLVTFPGEPTPELEIRLLEPSAPAGGHQALTVDRQTPTAAEARRTHDRPSSEGPVVRTE